MVLDIDHNYSRAIQCHVQRILLCISEGGGGEGNRKAFTVIKNGIIIDQVTYHNKWIGDSEDQQMMK